MTPATGCGAQQSAHTPKIAGVALCLQPPVKTPDPHFISQAIKKDGCFTFLGNLLTNWR